ncbi:unnamed protein product [Lactuca virosa]|uniref:Uncharacterized protein n=1 Tax=Lactuca virosa TaxID=75947 RepID=A0AAU9PDC7_9ASTR|nr:unnamed protein product [Lactuca virosa]
MCRSDLRSEEGNNDDGSSTLTSIAVFSGLRALWSMGTAEKEENDGKREDLWGLARPKEEATKLRWPSVGEYGCCRVAVGRLGWSQSAFPSAFLSGVLWQENKGEEQGRLWLLHLTEKSRKNNGDDLFFDWIWSTL